MKKIKCSVDTCIRINKDYSNPIGFSIERTCQYRVSGLCPYKGKPRKSGKKDKASIVKDNIDIVKDKINVTTNIKDNNNINIVKHKDKSNKHKLVGKELIYKLKELKNAFQKGKC